MGGWPRPRRLAESDTSMVDDMSFNFLTVPLAGVLLVNLAAAAALWRLPRTHVRRELVIYAACALVVIGVAFVVLTIFAVTGPMFVALALPACVSIGGLPAIVAVRAIRRLRAMTWEEPVQPSGPTRDS